jgi:c(7)-type cytochrome triheme protein
VRCNWPKALAVLLAAAAIVAMPPYASAAGAGGEVTAKTGYRRLVPAGSYGTIVMKRTIGTAEVKTAPVLFAHWSHRTRYTCSVCHVDLGFPLKAGETVVRHTQLDSGSSCGACHDGSTAFSTTTSCVLCHSYGVEDAGNPAIEETLKGLPKDNFGNRVDWSEALREGSIKPSASLEGMETLDAIDSDIILPVTKFSPHPPDVRFPHRTHTEVIGCDTCHPAIFAKKKGQNPEMSMLKFMSGRYCGACHGRVSFPLGDCFRCHSEPAPKPEGK